MMSTSGGDHIMAVKGTISGGSRFLAVVSNRRKNRRYLVQGFLWKIYFSRELKTNTRSVQPSRHQVRSRRRFKADRDEYTLP